MTTPPPLFRSGPTLLILGGLIFGGLLGHKNVVLSLPSCLLFVTIAYATDCNHRICFVLGFPAGAFVNREREEHKTRKIFRRKPCDTPRPSAS